MDKSRRRRETVLPKSREKVTPSIETANAGRNENMHIKWRVNLLPHQHSSSSTVWRKGQIYQQRQLLQILSFLPECVQKVQKYRNRFQSEMPCFCFHCESRISNSPTGPTGLSMMNLSVSLFVCRVKSAVSPSGPELLRDIYIFTHDTEANGLHFSKPQFKMILKLH